MGRISRMRKHAHRKVVTTTRMTRRRTRGPRGHVQRAGRLSICQAVRDCAGNEVKLSVDICCAVIALFYAAEEVTVLRGLRRV